MERLYKDTAALAAALLNKINEYLANEEAYGDNPQMQVKLPELFIDVVPEDDSQDTDDSADYYPVLDLLEMSTEQPGKWMADTEVIDELAQEYFK